MKHVVCFVTYHSYHYSEVVYYQGVEALPTPLTPT